MQFVPLLDGRGADLVHPVLVQELQPERVVALQQPQQLVEAVGRRQGRDVQGGVEDLGLIQPQVEGAVEPGQLLAQLRVLLDLVLLIVLVVGLEQLELEVQRLAGRVDVGSKH